MRRLPSKGQLCRPFDTRTAKSFVGRNFSQFGRIRAERGASPSIESVLSIERKAYKTGTAGLPSGRSRNKR